MKVGFIGLGNMGAPMAGWLLEAGFPLVVHDVRAEAAAGLLDRGAAWADSPGDVAEQCDVVVTCVPGPLEMEAVALGPDGLVAHVVRILEADKERPAAHRYKLYHGDVLHGTQLRHQSLRHKKVAYYGEKTGIGIAIGHHPKRTLPGYDFRVGVVACDVVLVDPHLHLTLIFKHLR